MKKILCRCLIYISLSFILLCCSLNNNDSSIQFDSAPSIDNIIISNSSNEEKDSSYLIYIKSLTDTSLINYYNNPIVVFWSPMKKEEDKYYEYLKNSYSRDDINEIEADMIYYMTEAQSFLYKEQEDKNIVFNILIDTNDCCGFIINNDTVQLCKANCQDYSIWSIILFNPPYPPLITNPTNVQIDFHEYFKK
jgi:hypothetical protein